MNMSGSSIGHLFRLSSFGESHSKAVGGILDGCPPGIVVDPHFISSEMSRRKPGQNNPAASPRNEPDEVIFLSGIHNQTTLGTPIGFMVMNKEAKSQDYDLLSEVFRPNHADYTYSKKYGIYDHRGGGRSSARETVSRVVGGAIAKLFLRTQDIQITSKILSIGPLETAHHSAQEIEDFLADLRQKGDTCGGIVEGSISGLPIGLGNPVFHKLHSELSNALLSIPSAKGFEYGDGFRAAQQYGYEHQDSFAADGSLLSNHSGGVSGGLSNGQNLVFRLAFKPIPTQGKPVEMLSKQGELKMVTVNGRHDACAVPRVTPIVEAMAALTIADHLLMYNAYRNLI